MAMLNLVFKKLGIPPLMHKSVGPATVLEYLGKILNSQCMEAGLTLDKVAKIISLPESFKERRT